MMMRPGGNGATMTSSEPIARRRCRCHTGATRFELWTTSGRLATCRCCSYVEHFDDPNAHASTIDLTAATGLNDDQIARALNALGRAEPPYLNIARSMGPIEPGHVLGVTERAYRDVGAWPTAEALTESIAAAFDRAADAEPDAEQKSKLKATAGWLGGAGRSIAVDVMTRFVERQAGLG
jgi:hypothetical protein